MVKIIDYKKRTNSEGEEFNALILQGGLEMVKSKESGNYYATAKTVSIASTFNDEVCKSLIGQEIPGSIQKVSCEPFEYTIKESGEIITLEHRWVYLKEGETAEDIVFEALSNYLGYNIIYPKK